MTNKKLIYIIILFLATLSFCSKISSKQDKIFGLWFSEFRSERNNSKLIYILQKTKNGINNGRLIGLDNSGGFVSYLFNLQKGKIFLENSKKSDNITFEGQDIMYYSSNGSNKAMVLKRIKDKNLSHQIITFVDKNKTIINNKKINDDEIDKLRDELKGLKLWDRIGMSSGKYLSLLKKKQKKKWDKGITEQDKKDILENNSADAKKLELIKGRWIFNKKDTYNFTNEFVCKTLGIKLYRLELENKPEYKDYEMSYTILINKKDSKSYLHLVYWKFEFQRPSIIEFKNKDKFITLFKNEVDSEAIRVESE